MTMVSWGRGFLGGVGSRQEVPMYLWTGVFDMVKVSLDRYD